MSRRGLPPQLVAEIDSPIRETRLQGVYELARLANGDDLVLAAAARMALQRITADDSRSVAAAAVAMLERTTVRVQPELVDFGQVPPGSAPLVTDVLVEGPPLAIAAAKVTSAGPGLRAMLNGRQLRIAWQPESEWLDGSVTVNGPAGWADVRVTGQVVEERALSLADVDEWFTDTDASASRVTVLTTPPKRRRVGLTVLVAGLTALVVLGGVGVAVALTGSPFENSPFEKEPPPLAAPASVAPSPSVVPKAAPATVPKVPLARSIRSVAKPAVLATIKVGEEPEGVAVSPDGRTIYVANQGAKVLSVVDAASRKVTSVKLRNTPRFVATSANGRQVFVSMYEDDKTGSGVAVIDAATRKVTKVLSTGKQPFTLAVAPDGRLWVPIHSSGRVDVFTASGQPDVRVEVPPNPHAVAFSASLRRAVTANHESNSVSIIDMRSDELIKSVEVSRSPHSVAFSPDGKKILVAGFDANTADLIDAITLKRTGPIRVGSKPQSVGYARDGAHAYVVNEGSNTISVLNGRTGAVTATIKVGRSPRTLAVAPDGRTAYVSNGEDNTISVLRVGE